MKNLDTGEYLRRSNDEAVNDEKSFGVTPLPRAPARGGFFETAGAIFRQDNIVVSALNDRRASFDRHIVPDPDFNGLEHIPPGHGRYAASYINATSMDDVRDMFFKIEAEIRDREMIAGRPLESFFVGMIAANADPSILFPGTLFYKQWRAQLSAAKQAGGVGGAMGAQTALQEHVLTESQEIRTAEESAYNILASTALGTALGALSGKFLNSPEGRTATRQTAQMFEDGDITPPGVAPLPDGTPPPKRPSGGGETIIRPEDGDYPMPENALPSVALKLPRVENVSRETSYAVEGMYHGTSREITELQNFTERENMSGQLNIGSVQTMVSDVLSNFNSNIYGGGFYTTNDPGIAKRYTKKGRAAAIAEGVRSPTIYKVQENYQIPLKNVDIQISEDVDLNAVFKGILKATDNKPWVKTALEAIQTDNHATFTEFMDFLREQGVQQQIDAADFQKFLREKILIPLSEKGYRGFKHEGGRLTKGKRHGVNIYWYPKDDLTILKLNEGGGGGQVPPTETSQGFYPPGGKSVGAANVMESALQGTALRMGEKAAKAYGTTLAKLTPSGRMATNPLGYIRLAGQSIFENNWRYQKNYSMLDETGKEKGLKPNPIALETRIKVDMGKVTSLMIQIENLYYQQRGLKPGVFMAEKDLISGKGLNREEFDDALFYAHVTAQDNGVPEVNQAAKLLYDFFEEHKQKYTELGVFPEGMTQRNSINYFTHYYNVPWIQDPANRPQAEQILTDYFKMVNNLVEENIDHIKAHKAALKATRKLIKKLKKTPKKEWPEGVTIKDLEEQIRVAEENFKEFMPEEIFDADWKVRSFVMDDDQIWVSVQNTLDNIQNLNESRFSNQYLSKMGIGGKPRPTNQRTLLIPTEQIGPMLKRSWRDVLPMFAKAMIPNYHITRFAQEMGFSAEDIDVNVAGSPGQVLGGFMAKAKVELDERLRGADQKETARLYKAFNDGQNDIKSGLELLLGTFGAGYNINDGSFAKFSKVMAAYNYTKMMGYMVVSSLTDMGAIVLRNGYGAMIHEGILPIVQHMKAANYNKGFMQDIGKGLEVLTGYRLKSYANSEDLINAPGRVSKAFDYLVSRYGNLSLMSPWTDMMHWITTNVFVGDLLRNTVGYKKNIDEIGKIYKERDKLLSVEIEQRDFAAIKALEKRMAEFETLPKEYRSKLLALGIEDQHLEVLYSQWAKVGGVDDGAFWIDWGAWDMGSKANIDALEAIQAALIKEIDSTIIIPGLGDKPLFARTHVGSLMTQFKSFSFGSTNRIFVSGLTHRDANFYNGIMSMLFLGAMGYVVSSLLKGKEIDTSIENMAFEAIDRSGLLGILMEVPLIMQKMGFLPGMGTSRYQSRDWVGALGGPTLGTVSDWVTLLNKYKNADEEPLTTKDFNKTWRQFPVNNVWWIDGLNINLGITDKFALSLGFEEAK